VLRGMSGTLGKSALAVGYVEIESHFLSRTGSTIERYDEEIISGFQLYTPVDQKSLLLKEYDSLGTYKRSIGQGRIHTDMILLRNPKAFDWLPPAGHLAQ
jgi:hypothetical protein